MAHSTPSRLIVGITGVTGIVYGVRALQLLRSLGIETHLVVSRAAELTRAYETDLSKEDLTALADHVHNVMDLGAAIASGSFPTLGMLIRAGVDAFGRRDCHGRLVIAAHASRGRSARRAP